MQSTYQSIALANVHASYRFAGERMSIVGAGVVSDSSDIPVVSVVHRQLQAGTVLMDEEGGMSSIGQSVRRSRGLARK